MKKYNGKSIFKGIAIGDILFYQKEKQQVKRQRVEDVVKEKEPHMQILLVYDLYVGGHTLAENRLEVRVQPA